MSTKKSARTTLPRARGSTAPRGATVPAPVSIDWGPLADAALVGAEWMLERAAEMVVDYPEEAAAVERVRAFAHARLAGVHVPLAVEDLLFVMGLVIQRLGAEPGIAVANAEVAERAEAQLGVFGLPLGGVVPLRIGRTPSRLRRCPGVDAWRVVRDPYIHAAA